MTARGVATGSVEAEEELYVAHGVFTARLQSIRTVLGMGEGGGWRARRLGHCLISLCFIPDVHAHSPIYLYLILVGLHHIRLHVMFSDVVSGTLVMFNLSRQMAPASNIYLMSVCRRISSCLFCSNVSSTLLLVLSAAHRILTAALSAVRHSELH